MNIKGYTINDDLSINVNRNVWLNGGLNKFPDYIKFNKIEGNFFCANIQLISLIGCPNSVGNIFNCDDNELISLTGCPSYAGRFYCNNNKTQFTKEDVLKRCKVDKNRIYV